MKLWLCFSRRGKGDFNRLLWRSHRRGNVVRVDRTLTIVALRNAAEQAGHLGIATLARKNEGGLVVVGREAGIGALAEEQLHNFGVDRVGSRSEHQRRIAAVVPAVHVGAAIEQQLYASALPAPAALPSAVSPSFVRARASAPLLEQQPHGVPRCRCCALPSTPVAPAAILASTCCALVDQKAHRVDIAAQRGRIERRQAVERRDIGIAAVLQQEPQNRVSIAKNCGLVNRSPPFDLLDRNRRSASYEQANLAFVVKRPEQGRRPAPILRVDVRLPYR
jgi:hypothetical protein